MRSSPAAATPGRECRRRTARQDASPACVPLENSTGGISIPTSRGRDLVCQPGRPLIDSTDSNPPWPANRFFVWRLSGRGVNASDPLRGQEDPCGQIEDWGPSQQTLEIVSLARAATRRRSRIGLVPAVTRSDPAPGPAGKLFLLDLCAASALCPRRDSARHCVQHDWELN